jgi:hypothetical protein
MHGVGAGMPGGLSILGSVGSQLAGNGGGGMGVGTVTGTGEGVGGQSQDRWDRLEVLFQSVRNSARGGYEYPGPSVVALESVLVRLYLESPMRGGGPT